MHERCFLKLVHNISISELRQPGSGGWVAGSVSLWPHNFTIDKRLPNAGKTLPHPSPNLRPLPRLCHHTRPVAELPASGTGIAVTVHDAGRPYPDKGLIPAGVRPVGFKARQVGHPTVWRPRQDIRIVKV